MEDWRSKIWGNIVKLRAPGMESGCMDPVWASFLNHVAAITIPVPFYDSQYHGDKQDTNSHSCMVEGNHACAAIFPM